MLILLAGYRLSKSASAALLLLVWGAGALVLAHSTQQAATTVLRGTYGRHKNLYIPLFLLAIFGPIYYGPQQHKKNKKIMWWKSSLSVLKYCSVCYVTFSVYASLQ